MNIFGHADIPENLSPVSLTSMNPEGLYDPTPNGYSHAVIARGGRGLAFISGQGGEDAAGNLVAGFEDQVRQAFGNLLVALTAVGAEPCQVPMITTYVVDHDEKRLALITDHVRIVFGNSLPAQSLVPVPRLALDGMLFEVEAIAMLDT